MQTANVFAMLTPLQECHIAEVLFHHDNDLTHIRVMILATLNTLKIQYVHKVGNNDIPQTFAWNARKTS